VRFGENVKRLRERLGITQEELARRMEYAGSKNANISTLEKHSQRTPRPGTVRKFARALECEPWELLEEVETEYDVLRRKPATPPRIRAR